MRNVWIYISSLAVVVAVGGAVYYFSSMSQTYVGWPNFSVPQISQVAPSVRAVPAGNPLLTANFGQFERWVPRYPIRCGEIVFERADPKVQNYYFCLSEIKRRVATHAQRDIRLSDVLDPRVRARWQQVMEDS